MMNGDAPPAPDAVGDTLGGANSGGTNIASAPGDCHYLASREAGVSPAIT
jgi:hypothetical protein